MEERCCLGGRSAIGQTEGARYHSCSPLRKGAKKTSADCARQAVSCPDILCSCFCRAEEPGKCLSQVIGAALLAPAVESAYLHLLTSTAM